MAGGNECIVNTLPMICEQLTIFYFQGTNLTACVKYAIISSILGGSAEQENFVPYYVIKFLQVIHSYVRNVGIKYFIDVFNFILPPITEFHSDL